jgi:hypothetical protein
LTALSVTVSGQPFDMIGYVAEQSISGLFFKSAYDAFNFENNVLTKITDTDYPGWSTVTPSSITRSGSIATVTLSAPVNWQSGSTVTISGAAQTEYNGDFTITVTDSTHFDVRGNRHSNNASNRHDHGNRRADDRPWRRISRRIFFRDGRKRGDLQLSGLNDPTSWGAS